MECPSCEKEFERLGLHWWHGSCPYPEIDSVLRDRLLGLLAGDGSIPKQQGGNNSIFHIPLNNLRFLRWLDTELGVLSTGVKRKKTAEQLAQNNRDSGFSPEAKSENYRDMYTIWTRTHPFFNELRGKWYRTGSKRIPDDFEITPRIAKFWYISDGYLDVGRWGRPRIEIKARTERGRSEFLLELFRRVGFEPVFHRSEIRFTCDDTERFIKWIGECPPGFEYKWAIDSREQYTRLKEKARNEYTTQTLSS